MCIRDSVCVLPLTVGDDEVQPAAEKLAGDLAKLGLEVVIDDRKERAGEMCIRDRSVVCVLASEWTTLALLVAMAGITAGEFYYMLRQDAKLPNEMLGIIAAMLYPVSVFFLGLNGALYVSLALLLALIVWYVFWMRARVPDVGVSFFGAAYCGMLLSGIIVVREALPAPWGGVLVLGILLSVWANDSFAYLVGSKFGKHKLAPRTSPKKSWEGFFAGLAGSAVFWCLMTLVPGVTMSIPQAILFGLASGLMGVLGDLEMCIRDSPTSPLTTRSSRLSAAP